MGLEVRRHNLVRNLANLATCLYVWSSQFFDLGRIALRSLLSSRARHFSSQCLSAIGGAELYIRIAYPHTKFYKAEPRLAHFHSNNLRQRCDFPSLRLSSDDRDGPKQILQLAQVTRVSGKCSRSSNRPKSRTVLYLCIILPIQA